MSSKSQIKRASIRTYGQLLQELSNFKDITVIKIKIIIIKANRTTFSHVLKNFSTFVNSSFSSLGNFNFLEDVEETFPTPNMLPWIVGDLLTCETPLFSEVVIVKTLTILASFSNYLSLSHLARN